MIPYVPEPFIDRSVQYPGRRYITRPDSTVELCQISRSHEGQNAEGAIYAEGTALNAQSFNDEMTKVKDTFDSIDTDLQAKQPALTAGSGILIQNNVISATGGSGTAAYLAGLADVGLYAPTSGEVLLFDGSQGKWINGDIVTGKKSGAVVAFGDGAGDLPVIDLNVEIKATQTGTGDPSPNNVRPISGRSSVNVTKAGKNIFDVDLIDSIDTDGNGTMRNGVIFSHAGTFTVDGTQTENAYIYGKIKSGSTYGNIIYFTSGSPTTFSRSVTIAQGEELLIYDGSAVATMAASKTRLSVVQIEVGSASTFEPYNATTVTIALGQTVYGGERNVTSGLQKVTHGTALFDGSESWSKNGETDDYINLVSTVSDLVSVANSDTVVRVKADKFNGVSANTALGAATKAAYQIAAISNNRVYVVMPKTVVDSATAFKTWLESNNVQIVYELAQPVTVQLTPTEIKTLQGNNTIFADSGDILNLEYYRDEAKKIIDLFQFDESLKAWTAENFAPLYTDVTGTLLAGETYLILNSPKIFTTSTIDIYTDTFGVAPYAIEVQNGNVRLTFVARASDLNVKVRIT